MHNVLGEFGLTENESKVYLAVLESGSALAGEITVKTGIHRRNVYDSIERLIKKGLIGYITINNRKYFKAANPRHFFFLLDQEKEEIKEKEKTFNNILPKLLLSSQLAKNKQKVTIYEGKKGHITVLEDVLKTGKKNLVFSTIAPTPIQEYLKLFHKRRVKAKIVDKLILNVKEEKRAKKLAHMPYTEVRLMPEGFESPLVLNIYGDKVGMLIYSDDPLAILIEDKHVAEAFKSYFNLMWNMAQKVK